VFVIRRGASPLPSLSTPTPLTPALRQSGRLLSMSTPSATGRTPSASTPSPSTAAEKKRLKFTDLEDMAILNWLAIGMNAESYIKGNKTAACKQIAIYLHEEKVSPPGIRRAWGTVKARLINMLKKYHEAIRKKKQTGWGAGRGEKTIKGTLRSFVCIFVDGLI
jgi:hypothetical protein